MSDGPVPERARRLRLVIALEIHRITIDLRERMDFLVSVWSRYRKREAFLDTLFSRWRTVTAGDLVELDEEVLGAVEGFYTELEHLHLYLAYTEDMPVTLRDYLEVRLRRLDRAAGPALQALGGVPEHVRPDHLPALALDVPGDDPEG